MNELERRREVQERLRVSEEQVASGRKTFVEIVDDAPPRAGVEVDEHVAAEHDIDTSQRGRLHAVEQVQVSEVANAPQCVGDVRAVFPFYEVGRPEGFRDGPE